MSRLAIRWARDLAPVGPVDRPEAHLLGTLRIAGDPHHVEAFEVPTSSPPSPRRRRRWPT